MSSVNRYTRAILCVFCGIGSIAALSTHDYPSALLLAAACGYFERRMQWK
jgi:hypothetical protein